MGLLGLDISKKLDQLPASSPAVTKLISVIDNPDTTRDEVLRLVTLDQVLFANAFKYANSAAIGSYRKLKSLTEIVDILGFGILRNIAILTALRSVGQDKLLWQEGIFIAIAAKKISNLLNLNGDLAEHVFMAALMQSYGAFALNHFYPKEYGAIKDIKDFKQRLAEEKKTFGMNHLELTVMSLKQWGLPERVTEIIANQENHSSNKLAQLNTIIDLSRYLFGAKDMDQSSLEKFLEENPELLARMRQYKILNPKISAKFIEDLFHDAEKFVNI